MDRALVGLILAALAGLFLAGSYALYWLLDRALDTINHLRRNR